MGERGGKKYKRGSPEPLSRESARGCCAGMGGELRPFDLRCSRQGAWKALVLLLLVGANEEARSSHRSANERLQLHCSLETRGKLYQSASPN